MEYRIKSRKLQYIFRFWHDYETQYIHLESNYELGTCAPKISMRGELDGVPLLASTEEEFIRLCNYWYKWHKKITSNN